jgi:hypothetical protein
MDAILVLPPLPHDKRHGPPTFVWPTALSCWPPFQVRLQRRPSAIPPLSLPVYIVGRYDAHLLVHKARGECQERGGHSSKSTASVSHPTAAPLMQQQEPTPPIYSRSYHAPTAKSPLNITILGLKTGKFVKINQKNKICKCTAHHVVVLGMYAILNFMCVIV